MRELCARVWDWFRRGTLERELREEMAFHEAQIRKAAEAEGMERSAAGQAARRRMGNELSVREAAFERWSLVWLEHLWRDVVYAFRDLRRSPGFTIAVLLTLTLGTAANATMFSVVDRLLLRPLELLREPARVNRIYVQFTNFGNTLFPAGVNYPLYRDLAEGTRPLADLIGFAEGTLPIGAGAGALRGRVAGVEPEFFDLFARGPAVGRYFGAAENVAPVGADVAVISHAYWQREYGGRDVLGEIVHVGNVQATIIGVAPRGLDGVDDADPPVIYLPLTRYPAAISTTPEELYSAGGPLWVNILVLRREGITPEQVATLATQSFLRSWEGSRQANPTLFDVPEVAQPRVHVASVRNPRPTLTRETRTALWLTGVSVMVLLIAVANVTNMFVARAIRRQRETAVRQALGISRARLFSKAIVESTVLAGLAGVCSVLVSHWGSLAMLRLLFPYSPPGAAASADVRTIAVVLGVTILIGLVTGLLPAVIMARRSLAGTLRAGVRGGVAQHGRLRAGLVVVQGTLSVALLIGAGLFVRSHEAARRVPLGYDPENILLVNPMVRGEALSREEHAAMRNRLIARARSIPQVAAASWAMTVPTRPSWTPPLFIDGVDSVSTRGRFVGSAVTPGYFDLMKTPILRGRPITDADGGGAPAVVVVSEGMARALWPESDALGKCIRIIDPSLPCAVVVGIAGEVRHSGLDRDTEYRFYLAFDQYSAGYFASPETPTQLAIMESIATLVLRLRNGTNPDDVRRALLGEMHGNSYVTTLPMVDQAARMSHDWRVGARMFLAFGGLALVVTAVGLYGVIAYNVNQRMHVLDVRRALGAQRGAIVRLVTAQSATLVVTGIVFGVLIALYAGSWLQPLLFQQSARDPRVFAIVGITMLLVALLASAIPALRATRAEPHHALRSD